MALWETAALLFCICKKHNKIKEILGSRVCAKSGSKTGTIETLNKCLLKRLFL